MYICCSIRNVKFINESFYNMCCLVIFITAVCLIFLLKLKWPKNKSVHDLVFDQAIQSEHWRTDVESRLSFLY